MYRLYLECSFMYSWRQRQWKYIKLSKGTTNPYTHGPTGYHTYCVGRSKAPSMPMHAIWHWASTKASHSIYENSGTLTPLIYHALSGTGKPCSLLVASNSFFLRKSNSWKRTKYRIRWKELKCQTLRAAVHVIVLVCWLESLTTSWLSHACHVHSVLFLPTGYAKFAHEFLKLFHRPCATYL